MPPICDFSKNQTNIILNASDITFKKNQTNIFLNALCSPPNVNSSIRDLSQISTTALIFMKTNYFRQDIWINI